MGPACPVRSTTIEEPLVTDAKRQRRFQFSLRKLIIWTAVAAFYLSVVRLIGLPDHAVVVSCLWLMLLVLVQEAIQGAPALYASVCLSGCIFTVYVVWWQPNEGFITLALSGLVVGTQLGFVAFVPVSWVKHVVDKIDNLLRTKVPSGEIGNRAENATSRSNTVTQDDPEFCDE
jgi:hypothetical protein